MFKSVGSPYVGHKYIRLHANGDYFGLYVDMEHPDARWLERNGLNREGNLYKATASREEVNGTYEKKTNENGDMSDLRTFLRDMHATPRAELVSFFEERVDPDITLEYQMSQVLMNNRDYPHKNHYLYHDTDRGKWMPTAWDLDLVYGKRWDGNFEGVLNDAMDNPGTTPWHTTNVRGGGTGNHFLDKFFAQGGDYYRRAYLVRLWDALHEKFTVEQYEERIQDYHGFLLEEQADDIAEWGRSRPSANDRNAPAEFEPNLDRVRNHIRIRRNFLINYLRNTESFSGHARVKITEIMYNPPGSDDLEYLELWNNSGAAIDVSGWRILGIGATNEEGVREEFSFPDETRLDTDEVIIVAKNPDRFALRYGNEHRVFGPYPGNLGNGGDTLRVRDAGPGHPATVDFLRYGTSPPWPIRADGLGYSMVLDGATPDLDNDVASAWRLSDELGGSPGALDGASIRFSRGNCNGDDTVNLSDALTLLNYLFRGGAEPGCLQGCDTSGNDNLGIEDAIGLLTHLFIAGGFDIPSPGPEGCAPAQEGFCEETNCL